MSEKMPVISQQLTEEECGNPLREFISDEQYKFLLKNEFLNETVLRDWIIRRKYKILRSKRVNREQALLILQEKYFPHLQFNTLGKIVINKPTGVMI